ncbi:MAG TPA: hypothetical protein VFE33_21375 [Thermoanaerobaculia bacterium]|nr:hypothetical protein [Thermoanaerobaculia bacterium]
MATIHLDGTITEQGQLEVELPEGLPAGKARATIEVPSADWTAEELAEALKVHPLTGAEIIAAGLTGGWKDEVSESGAEWVERQRRQRRCR